MAPLREEDGAAASDEEDPTVQATVGHRISPLASARPVTGRRLPHVGEDEPDEPGSITATAPVLTGAPKLPLSASRNVEIRAIEEELGDETEVRTLPGSRAPVAKPSVPPTPSDDEDAPRIRISPKSLMPPPSSPPPASRPPASYASDRGPASGLPLSDAPTATRAPVPLEVSVTTSALDVYGEEEAVTTHGISLGSVPRAPVATQRLMPPLDPADPTTQRLDRGSASVQAGLPSAAPFEEDDPHNRTAVMANAPMLRAAQNAGMAPQFQSEGSMRSGLPSGDRVVAMPPHGSSASMLAAAPHGGPPPNLGPHFAAGAPAREDKPNYGVLVAVVAAVSIVVPVLVFVVLNQSNDGVTPRVAAQPSPDFVKRADGARPRGKAPSLPEPSDEAPSAAPSAKPLRHR